MSDRVIGNAVTIRFVTIGNKELPGKVDTGATTSSIHATDISTGEGGKVSFSCPQLSDGILTVSLGGAQTVHTSDNGGEQRPVVKLDIEVDGVLLRDVAFNLNDRSGMDCPILIGQNVLKPGGFVIDVNKDAPEAQEPGADIMPEAVEEPSEHRILEAVRVLVDENVTLAELVMYLRTEALARAESE